MATRIYDGSKDSTNFISDKFLELNSAGTQIAPKGAATVRRSGRVDYHLLFVVNGRYAVKHGGEEYILGEGNFVLYAPGEYQSYEAIESSRSYWIHFSGIAVPEILESCGLSSGAYTVMANSVVFEKCSQIIGHLYNSSSKMLANAALIEILYHLGFITKEKHRETIPSAILTSVAYINMNYDKNICLDELARLSGYSKSRFSHLFSEYMGTTPIKYQNKLRLENARDMLLSSEISIGEIAYLCGFTDQLYFSRVFKKEFGISPSDCKDGRHTESEVQK